MKYLFLCLYCLPGLLAAQLTEIPLPEECISVPCPANLLAVEPTTTGHRVLVQFDCTGSLRKTEAGFEIIDESKNAIGYTLIYVIDYRKNFSLHQYKNYLLENLKFTSSIYSNNTTAPAIALEKDLISYNEFIALYPEFSHIESFDEDNKLLPDNYVESQLKYSNFKGKILGFESSSYTLSTGDASEAKNKSSKYHRYDHLKSDWEDAYNGGQSNKNFWVHIASASCPKTGNLVALNGKKIEDSYVNQNKELEIVAFNNKGEVIKRQEIHRKIPWTKRKDQAHYSNTSGTKQLEYLVVISKQNSSQTENPDRNLEQFSLTAIAANSDIIFDTVLDTDNNAFSVDTILCFDNAEFLFTAVSGNVAYLVKASPQKQSYTTFELHTFSNIPSGTLTLKDVTHHQDETYLAYDLRGDTIENSGVVVYIAKAGKHVASHYFPKDKTLIDEKRSIQFVNLHMQNPILLIKEYVRNGIEGAPGIIGGLYKLSAEHIPEEVNLGPSNIILGINDKNLRYRHRIQNYKGANYIVTKKYSKNQEGEVQLINTLTKLPF